MTLMGSVEQVGELMAYGANFGEQVRRAASYVDQDPEGREPAELPVEQAQQVRASDQYQDREGARPHDPAVGAGAGGPGDRVR